MSDTRCHRCDRLLVDGRTRYIISIHVTADFDGYLADVDDPGVALQGVLASLDGRTEADLADEVHRELAFMLCGGCRGRWLDNPLGVRRSARPSAAFLH